MVHLLVEAIDMPRQFLSWISLVEERLQGEFGRAEETIGQTILLFLLAQLLRVEGVFMM